MAILATEEQILARIRRSELAPGDKYRIDQLFLQLQRDIKSFRTITSSETLTENDVFVEVDATAGPVTITLIPAATHPGKGYEIKKIDASANAVTVDGDGAETIDDAATRILALQYDAIGIRSVGTEWWIK